MRSRPTAALAAVAAMVLATAPALRSPARVAATDPCSARVTVEDADRGEPIAGARLTVLPEGPTARTGEDGVACLPPLEPGRYPLLAVADGHSVATTRLDIPAEGVPRLTLRMMPAFGEEMVVTATRTEKRLADTPVHVQVLDRRQVERTASRTLADAVEWASGVRVESNCQNCNFSQVRMLGLEGPYTQILIDGQPTVSSLAMVYGIEHLPARMVDSIEVVKGGGSALYGAGAVGGVINLITHRPSEVGAMLDGRGTQTGGTGYGSSLSAVGDWTSTDRTRSASLWVQRDEVPAVDLDGDGFTELARRELASGGLSGERYLLDAAARLTVDLTWSDEDRRGGELAFHLPPEETALTEQIRSRRLGGGVRWLHTPSPRLDYRIGASWVATERDSYYGAGFDPDAYGTTENPLLVLDGQVNHYRGPHTLTWGVQYQRDEVVDRQLGHGREIGETFSGLGLYVQENRDLGAGVSLLAGTRVDRHSAVEEPILSPRLALLWSPRADLTVRTSVARGFRAPVIFDEDLHVQLVGGGEVQVVERADGLREETSTAALLSVEWRPTLGRRGSAALAASLFRTGLSDLFNTRERDDPATPEVEMVRENFGGATVQGVELSFAWRWGSRLSGEVGMVEQRSRFDRPEPDFGSRDFFRTPERYGLASLAWRLPRQVDLFLGARYTGSMKAPHYAGFIAADRLEQTPPFLTLDLNLSRSWTLPGLEHGEVTVTAGGRNLTDEYQEDLDRGPDRDSAYAYGPRFPRSLLLGLKVDL